MESPPLRWKVIAGFLVMNLLITVTSAVMCHRITTFTKTDEIGSIIIRPFGNDTSCLPIHNACATVRLELSTVSHTLLVHYRECATIKYPNRGKESFKTGDKYFAIKYEANYCSSDLCNGEIASVDVQNKTTLVKEKCKPSSSRKCYAGINFHESEERLEAVTCRSDSDYCYQGSGRITIGNDALHLYIRSCQSTCHLPHLVLTKKQVFGPIEISLKGTCCFGSHCNKKVNAHPTPTTQTWENTSELYGHGTINHTGNFTNLGDGYGIFRDFECEDYIVDNYTVDNYIVDNVTEWSFIDPGEQGLAKKSKGAALQISTLLVTLVVTVLGLSW